MTTYYLGHPRLFEQLFGSEVLPSFVYGFNTIIVFQSLRLLWKKGRSQLNQRPLITGCTVALHALSTFHLLMGWLRGTFSLITSIIPKQNDPRITLEWNTLPGIAYKSNDIATVALIIAHVVLGWLTQGLLVSPFIHPSQYHIKYINKIY